MSDDTFKDQIAKAIEKLPQWLRHDLSSAEPALRERAQESLVAMIVAVIDSPADKDA